MGNSVTRPYGDYFPFGMSLRVSSMQYAADIGLNTSDYEADFGAPLALDADGVLAACLMVNGSAVTVNTFTAGVGTATAIGYNGLVPFDSTTIRGGWGRGLTVVASAANARTMTVTGYDYLGSKMIEVITINGTTPVNGLKAFTWIESIVFSSSTDTTTVDVGYRDMFGLPYAGEAKILETKNGAVAANAGTFVAALANATAATGTNADVRGTILFLTVIPDGTNTFKLRYSTRRGNLHGNAQYAG
jgi:hypothetical protein